ncbi:MAG: V-type ATP synthase subunit A, partial [Clostridiaceae bacterium]|nr:V-type ATP synthase subunit A [Clostridiaceae bacterium]
MSKRIQGEIVKVSGPLVIASGMRDADMFDVVEVSDKKLIGEIIEMHGDEASIQVYEETAGLGPGEEVVSRGTPLSVELGPGMIGSIYDGIQRPLDRLAAMEGDYITRGAFAPALDRDKTWVFKPVLKEGDVVRGGDVIGIVDETEIMEHRILVPPGLSGTLKAIYEGDFKVTDTVAIVEDEQQKTHELTMMQRWP